MSVDNYHLSRHFALQQCTVSDSTKSQVFIAMQFVRKQKNPLRILHDYTRAYWRYTMHNMDWRVGTTLTTLPLWSESGTLHNSSTVCLSAASLPMATPSADDALSQSRWRPWTWAAASMHMTPSRTARGWWPACSLANHSTCSSVNRQRRR